MSGTDEQIEADIRRIGEALSMGVAGDLRAGLEHLGPVIEQGRRATYALFASLAETASHIALREKPAGAWFEISVEDATSGNPASLDETEPEVAFAARFVTAWANRDHATCEALFAALSAHAEATTFDALVDALIVVFEMAVATAKDVAAEEAADRTKRED